MNYKVEIWGNRPWCDIECVVVYDPEGNIRIKHGVDMPGLWKMGEITVPVTTNPDFTMHLNVIVNTLARDIIQSDTDKAIKFWDDCLALHKPAGPGVEPQ